MATGVLEALPGEASPRPSSRTHPEAPRLILLMETGCGERDLRSVVARIETLGFRAEPCIGTDRALIGVKGSPAQAPGEVFAALPGVEQVRHVDSACKFVSLEAQPGGSTVRLGGFEFGSGRIGVIAGPCAVESREQILRVAEAVKAAGAIGLRGGAFKPRTSPYSFRGLGEEALEYLAEAREQTGLPVCTEVIEAADVPLVAQCADMLQIGARNMQNYPLLEAVGRTRKPVLLKRGFSATDDELLQAAEYIAQQGNKAIVLCERGIRTFETFTRNTLSLSIVPHLKRVTHLPVIVDPSHGTGDRGLVEPASLGAIAVGADGLLIEVHDDPARAWCDGNQSLTREQFEETMVKAARVAQAVGRSL